MLIWIMTISFAVGIMFCIHLAFRTYYERDAETVRRKWIAVSPAGNVVLGHHLNYSEALERATKLGIVTIAYTDLERGYIFYNVTPKFGGNPE